MTMGKLMMTIGAAVVSLTAFAEPPVFESKTVGFVIREAATEDATKTVRELVAVPFAGMDGEPISIAEVFASTELVNGDRIYVFDKAKDHYNAWAYDGEAWKPMTTLVMDANSQSVADEPVTDMTAIPAGSAVWLERDDATKPVVLVGRTTKAPAPQIGVGWNLVASPKAESFNLNAVVKGENLENDKILVPTGGAPIVYTYENGAWGCIVTEVKEIDIGGSKLKVVETSRSTDAEHTTVPAGHGFWYISAGGTPTFKW